MTRYRFARLVVVWQSGSGRTGAPELIGRGTSRGPWPSRSYANGDIGTKSLTSAHSRMRWHRSLDDLVITTTFTRRPVAYGELCPTSIGLRPQAGEQTFPVLSVLSSGGGTPVLSSGLLMQDPDGQWTLLLPAAPGTSGAPVVDPQGNFVGLTSQGLMRGGAEASFTVRVVPGHWVVDLVRHSGENNDGQ